MRYTIGLARLPAVWASADKKLPLEQNSNELVEISGTLLDKDQVIKELGSDPGPGIIVVRTSVRPLTEKPVRIDYDDFFLLNTNDGERSAPFAPTQIAGSGVLVVTPQGARKGGMMGERGGPIWGGIPGAGGTPRRLPGNDVSMGSGGGEGTTNDASVKTENSGKENPLLKVLKAKALPEKETADTVSGLLYFEIDGKVKPKDLELHYKSAAGRLALRFKP